ncbi:MAG: HAD-IC family P-type ATPase [Oscillospiraceae bacterium]|jgi:cation-transporting ATPase E|nr:HAD-IC family P-type ATPase [Oscillospiraceae bacterium]
MPAAFWDTDRLKNDRGVPLMRTQAIRLHKVLQRAQVGAETGLTHGQVAERLENGYANVSPAPPDKTAARIVCDNVFTYFNLIFIVLSLCVIAVGAYNNLTFMPVVLINCAIGIIQELRAKRTLAAMTFVEAPQAEVVRDGQLVRVPHTQTVLDDVAVFRAGNQIYADAVVLAGECQVNEALVTGEADEITKIPGDKLLSGSYLVSGECRARLDKVGRDSFVSQLTIEARKNTREKRSGMMHSLSRLVQVIGFIVIPFGAIMYYQQTVVLGRGVQEGVLSAVAALIGMIPEGLYLLVSVALAVSIMRLAKKRTLVHEMRCIETLARVDVLCVDKTGTITENAMTAAGVELLREDRFNRADIDMIMADYMGSMNADNETMAALRAFFTGRPRRRAARTVPFSSALKYAGASFGDGEAYLLGAPEKILLQDYDNYSERIESLSSAGYRVLLLALYDGDIAQKGINAPVMPLALILLTNNIRPQAPKAFKFFADQGVEIKVISGDNPMTVSRIAQEAGIRGAHRCVDASGLNTERKIKRAVEEYTVFGRVTPEQKRKLVRALKGLGRTVAMTGDGVNDVLAMKESDCGVAMASGSDVACHVAHLVLKDSNFAAMPSVVMEGRRVINNIERSASLFLAKNIFSFTLAALALTFTLTYPINPAQLSLFNMMFIGIPSFVLALEPNVNIVRGRFLVNVIIKAMPAGLTSVLAVLAAMKAGEMFGIAGEVSTMATTLLAFVGMMMLFVISRPLNPLRRALMIAMGVGFAAGGLLLHDLFELAAFTLKGAAATAAIAALAAPVMFILCKLCGSIARAK